MIFCLLFLMVVFRCYIICSRFLSFTYDCSLFSVFGYLFLVTNDNLLYIVFGSSFLFTVFDSSFLIAIANSAFLSTIFDDNFLSLK